MTQAPVVFGTSGHRGEMGDAFTHQHVRAIAKAILAVYHEQGISSPFFVIGYDSRKGNDPIVADSYTQCLWEALVLGGAQAVVCETPTPTPVVAWAVRHGHFDGGILLTASHNPACDNGLKINPGNGAPAPESMTHRIECLANEYLEQDVFKPPQALDISPTYGSFQQDFSVQMQVMCGQYFGQITIGTVSIGIDAKHGSVASTWEALSKVFGFRAQFCHKEPLSDFGGLIPNPTDKQGLDALRAMVCVQGLDFGIANDPDGDRHLIVDEQGDTLTPEETLVILAHFWCEQGLSLTHIGTTVASSRLVTSFCHKRHIECVQTKIGFKYFTPLFEQCDSHGGLAFAVESSGGFSASCHTWEKC